MGTLPAYKYFSAHFFWHYRFALENENYVIVFFCEGYAILIVFVR